MTEVRSQICDVDTTNFEEVVLQGSKEKLIVVDFWAPWCEPCKTLGPILEEVVTSLGTGVVLAKVNIDENQQLAQAFRVQSIPAVKIVKDGQLVEEFTGALPREQIEQLLRPLAPDAPAAPEEEGEDLMEQAGALLQMGDFSGATRAYQQRLEETPDDGKALVGLARIRLFEGDFEGVRELAGRIEIGTPEYEQGQALLTHIGFHQTCEQVGGRQACAQALLANPDDLDARYNFACCAAVEGDYDTALKEWLTVIERQKTYRDGAAKDAMVSVFHLLGRHNEVVADFPQRLYRTLY